MASKPQSTCAAAKPAPDRTGLAIVIMIVAVAMLVLMSTCVKLVGPEYHVFQVVFLRNVVAMVVMLPFVLYDGGVSALKTRRPFLQLTRSVSGLTGVCCFFYAVQHMPIADVTVISQAVPLFVTALAVPLLHERVGWRRMSAVATGFAGVVMALGPVGHVSAAALVAVCGTALWAVTMLTVRTLGATDNPSATTFYYMVFGTLVAGAVQPWFWEPVTTQMLLLCLGAGALGALAQLLIAFALKYGEASVVTPFNYTAIIWGIVVDLLLWSVWPQWWTLAGAAVITAAGIYIFRREAARKARAD
jgi:drug/metabolite transporter (DMT)-like permease